ncbi:SDR family NAD(P)-dependent oxidoreductase [Yinghuangia seranimata]|uniref:SDR family NAD(P)-dependent oxidoreductase n=1 Tax=Yinghuangia seranimata TaxID=408067 RepID=UPI00248D113D|nr:SDR family oxidoreductase [Yinghuangia seranimata]MDI2132665.1 SDR family oxidoreductase [Yinghuangia seranimata]
MGTLEGRVAVVAGAGEGIGLASALALAGDGADLVLGARRAEPLRALAERVARETGRTVHAVPTDIADPDACHALVAAAADRLGRVDAVVNVATYNPSGRVEDLDREEFRRAFDVNVLGVLEVSRAALPHMRAVGGGAIVQISSEAPRMKLPHMAAYASTKMAMEIASATLAREVGRDGIRVNVVVAGYTDNAKLTAYLEDVARRRGSTPEAVREEFAASAALRRITEPADIAEAVLFLVSPRARGITGTVTHVNSGVVLEP